MLKIKLARALRIKTGKENIVSFELPKHYLEAYASLLQKSPEYLSLEIGLPRKARTTGDLSQNHAVNGSIQQICVSTSQDFDAMKYYLKYKAIDRGYPFDTIDGMVVPWSESRIDTIQCGYLIDAIYQFAAEQGIKLYE